MTPYDRVALSLSSLLGDNPPARIGAAVSGGGDSVAMLSILAEWAAARQITLFVVTVDHGLRPESADEAAQVGHLARGWGLSHDILRWNGWDGRGNLQAAARAGRYRLLADWARARGTGYVFLGHTRDDQAETMLLRLARGSGVDGLRAMSARRRDGGIDWLRPMLNLGRQELRAYLRTRGIGWIDDPGNDNDAFDRIKARRLLADPPLPSLNPRNLAATAQRMQAASRVLRKAAWQAAQELVSLEGGDLVLPLEGFVALENDTRWRLLAAAIGWTTGQTYRPRFAALCAADDAVKTGRAATLQGALLSVRRGELRIGREPAAISEITFAPALWDGRWRVTGPAEGRKDRLTIRALDRAALARLGQPESDLPRQTLMASPAIYCGGNLVAAPVAFPAGPWRARFVRDRASFLDALVSD